MTHPLRLALFLALATAQLLVPLSIARQQERIRRDGTVFKFRVEMAYPNSGPAGRQIRLEMEQAQVPLPAGRSIPPRKVPVFVTVEADRRGFARIVDVDTKPPSTGIYFRALGQGTPWRRGSRPERAPVPPQVILEFPFSRYHVSEHARPKATSAIDWAPKQWKSDTHVSVRVMEGLAVLDALVVDGKPIEEHLAEQAAAR